jgi:hypothetical protein
MRKLASRLGSVEGMSKAPLRVLRSCPMAGQARPRYVDSIYHAAESDGSPSHARAERVMDAAPRSAAAWQIAIWYPSRVRPLIFVGGDCNGPAGIHAVVGFDELPTVVFVDEANTAIARNLGRRRRSRMAGLL